MMRKKRMVRLHLYKDAPSIEGILVARSAGYYKIVKPVLLASEGQSHEMDGEVWVPVANVLMVQVIG